MDPKPLSPPIEPSPGIIIVVPYVEDTKGVSLAAGHETKDFVGVVVAVGEETITERGFPLTTKVKVGNIVMHKEYGIWTHTHANRKIRLMDFRDIIAVIKEAK